MPLYDVRTERFGTVTVQFDSIAEARRDAKRRFGVGPQAVTPQIAYLLCERCDCKPCCCPMNQEETMMSQDATNESESGGGDTDPRVLAAMRAHERDTGHDNWDAPGQDGYWSECRECGLSVAIAVPDEGADGEGEEEEPGPRSAGPISQDDLDTLREYAREVLDHVDELELMAIPARAADLLREIETCGLAIGGRAENLRGAL